MMDETLVVSNIGGRLDVKEGGVAVGCCGDWMTTEYALACLALGKLRYYLTTRPKRRFPAPLRSYVEYRPTFRWKLGLLKLPILGVRDLQSSFVFSEFQRFDRTFASRLNGEEEFVFAWAAMARQTLRRAHEIGARTALHLGNSHIRVYRSALEECSGGELGISDEYLEAQEEEYDSTDFILVESVYVRDGLINNGVNRNKIVIVPFPTIRQGIFGSRRVTSKLIFGVIVASRRKGTHDVLDYWRRISPPNAELWLIGGVEKGLLSRGKLPSGVRILGLKKGLAYVECLKQIDVALFPTYEDGGPRALVESMAAGACPLCSERCAGPDIIKNGQNGFVIPLVERSLWFEKLSWCIENPDAVRELGDAARRSIEEAMNMHHLTSVVSRLLGPVAAATGGVGNYAV